MQQPGKINSFDLLLNPAMIDGQKNHLLFLIFRLTREIMNAMNTSRCLFFIFFTFIFFLLPVSGRGDAQRPDGQNMAAQPAAEQKPSESLENIIKNLEKRYNTADFSAHFAQESVLKALDILRPNIIVLVGVYFKLVAAVHVLLSSYLFPNASFVFSCLVA